VIVVGWKEFYHKTFEEEYNNAKNWGDLEPIRLTLPSNEVYYTVGYAGAPAGWKFSPKIQHPQGVKTRIRVKYFFWVEANATGKASMGVVFFKDGDAARDPDGCDFHGVSHSINTAPSVSTAEKHEFVMEYDGSNKITYFDDGRKLDEATLELPLVSFKIAVTTNEANNGDVGILIYEVVAEYYDVWEDWVNQIYSVMQWMIPIMMVIMVVIMIVSVLKKKG